MFSFESLVRVRYADTDQMRVVYHAKFIEYFESGRTESIRSLGITYKEIEEMGIYMPVVRVQCDFIRPGRYDDLLTIKTMLKEITSDHRIEFKQEAYNDTGKLLCKATVLLYFMDTATNSKTTMPTLMADKLQPYFQ